MRILVGLMLFLTPSLAPADQGPVRAICEISCTVAEVVEWSDETLAPVDPESPPAGRGEVKPSPSFVLRANEDVQIIADCSGPMELSRQGLQTLIVRHDLEHDVRAIRRLGGNAITWTDHDSFVAGASTIVRVPGDAAVEVGLPVPIPESLAGAARSGPSATMQTFTVCWK